MRRPATCSLYVFLCYLQLYTGVQALAFLTSHPPAWVATLVRGHLLTRYVNRNTSLHTQECPNFKTGHSGCHLFFVPTEVQQPLGFWSHKGGGRPLKAYLLWSEMCSNELLEGGGLFLQGNNNYLGNRPTSSGGFV